MLGLYRVQRSPGAKVVRAALAASAAGLALGLGAQGAAAQPTTPPGAPQAPPAAVAGEGTAGRLLKTPVSKLIPGNVPIGPGVESPVGDSPQAANRGMQYFVAMNCVGCHAPNAGGGMGPSLSNGTFLYGSEPANIYLSIYQGRPQGMPAWGVMLPDNVIWDLVAYVRSIGKEPAQQWGRTVSRQMPQVEQVPAEYVTTATPWDHTEAFSHGQKPNTAK
jgi:cytochrome c oxidase cbb3-type subunit 3